jgi:hypothetical protein
MIRICKGITYLLLLFGPLAGCGQNLSGKNQDKEIRAIRISRKFPWVDTNGVVFRYDPFETRIYYYKDQVMYQTYYYHAEINTPEDLESPEYKYLYYSFVFSKNGTYGIRCDSLNLETTKVVTVDSMLAGEWAARINFSRFFRENKTNLLSVTRKPGETQEVFSASNLKDTGMKGSIILSYTAKNLQGIGFSFSKELDSAMKMKLYKVVMINDARFLKENKVFLMRAEIPYIMEDIPVTNSQELRRLFEKENSISKK